MDTPVGNEGSLTGTSPKTVLDAPPTGGQRVLPVNGLVLYNADTVPHNYVVQKDKNGTPYPVWSATGVAAGAISKVDVPITLDDTDETVQALSDATATTTEPTFNVSAGECS